MEPDISDKNSTSTVIKATHDVALEIVDQAVKIERETTQRAKTRFLDIFEDLGGVNVSHASQLAKISRDTFYRWLHEDEQFKSKVVSLQDNLNDFVEDLLFKKMVDGDGSSIRFYLVRRHPKYQPAVEPPPRFRTLEDLIDEARAKRAIQ